LRDRNAGLRSFLFGGEKSVLGDIIFIEFFQLKGAMKLMALNDIQTWSGRSFDPFNPDPEVVCIEDIAHALANLCRFGGHCKRFYSVAQHSVLVSETVKDASLRMEALLHDASEAYLVDLPGGLKHQLPEYLKLEEIWIQAIADHFQRPLLVTHSKTIKEADNILLVTEKRDLMKNAYRWAIEDDYQPRAEIIIPLSPNEAEVLFFQRFQELQG
jgi:hypothetical protein